MMTSDESRTHLRSTLAKIDHELAQLPGHGGAALIASFADLVGTLDLGPEPETRVCPVCGRVGMRAATHCGHCWTKLSPIDVSLQSEMRAVPR